MEVGTVVIIGIFALMVLVIVVLILREIAVWYFKIDERIANQKRIIQLLEDLRDRS